jgi:ATP-dependent helicase HrpA
VIRLILGELKQEVRYLKKNLPDIQRSCLMFGALGSADTLLEDILLTAIERAFLEDVVMPRNEVDFRALVEAGRDRYITEANRLAQQLSVILALHAEIRERLNRDLPLSWIEAARDIERQIAALVYPGFLRATPAKWFARLPRYLQAVHSRMQKLDAAPDRDRHRRAEVEPLVERLGADAALASPGRVEYRWLLEELRVSLFAQELGVPEKVSVKRLDKLWQSLNV